MKRVHPEVAEEFVEALTFQPASQSSAYRSAYEMALADTRVFLRSITVDSHAALLAEYDQLISAAEKVQKQLVHLLHAKQRRYQIIEAKAAEQDRLFGLLWDIRAALEV